MTLCPGRANTRSTRPAASADRKSTRLNSSHDQISYAVFCLKKKKNSGTPGYDSGSECAGPRAYETSSRLGLLALTKAFALSTARLGSSTTQRTRTLETACL